MYFTFLHSRRHKPVEKEDRKARPSENTGSTPSVEGASAGIYCKLFSDMVSEHLCVLRKNELSSKGAFSCEGCARRAP